MLGAPENIPNFLEARNLRTEAEALEAWHGPNAYSTYLRKHSRRPNPDEAAGIGRLLGGQVKANDGSMQPPLTAADRRALREIKSRRKAAARRYEHIFRLKAAIAALAENEDEPAEVIGDGSCVLDGSEIDALLDNAVCWLNRFAEHWHGRTKETCTTNPQFPGGNHRTGGA